MKGMAAEAQQAAVLPGRDTGRELPSQLKLLCREFSLYPNCINNQET